MTENILCRKCGFELNNGLDMFIHNLMAENSTLDCNRDSAIEYLEQCNEVSSHSSHK